MSPLLLPLKSHGISLKQFLESKPGALSRRRSARSAWRDGGLGNSTNNRVKRLTVKSNAASASASSRRLRTSTPYMSNRHESVLHDRFAISRARPRRRHRRRISARVQTAQKMIAILPPKKMKQMFGRNGQMKGQGGIPKRCARRFVVLLAFVQTAMSGNVARAE